jgi:hypothetical protein
MTTRHPAGPKAQAATVAHISGVTDAFCADHLDDEYADRCRHLTVKLARKRPSPLVRGDRHNWAAAIIHTVATANFLYDRTQRPHLRVDDVATFLGVSKSTMTAKAALIRKILRIDHYDPELCRPSMIDRHPYAWYVELDGYIVDARGLPAPLFEDARRRGLVPAH